MSALKSREIKEPRPRKAGRAARLEGRRTEEAGGRGEANERGVHRIHEGWPDRRQVRQKVARRSYTRIAIPSRSRFSYSCCFSSSRSVRGLPLSFDVPSLEECAVLDVGSGELHGARLIRTGFVFRSRSRSSPGCFFDRELISRSLETILRQREAINAVAYRVRVGNGC